MDTSRIHWGFSRSTSPPFPCPFTRAVAFPFFYPHLVATGLSLPSQTWSPRLRCLQRSMKSKGAGMSCREKNPGFWTNVGLEVLQETPGLASAYCAVWEWALQMESSMVWARSGTRCPITLCCGSLPECFRNTVLIFSTPNTTINTASLFKPRNYFLSGDLRNRISFSCF